MKNPSLFWKIAIWIPVIGLIIRYRNLEYKTSVIWDVYQLLVTTLFIGFEIFKLFGYALTWGIV